MRPTAPVRLAAVLAGGFALPDRPAPAAAPPAAAPARVDALGDPLPPGCVARFGTDRMRTTSHPSAGAVVWSPDGKRVAVTQPLSAARVWDAETGRLVRHFDGPFDYGPAAFAPDGKSLLIAERRGVVWRLDLAAGTATVLLDSRHGRPRPKGPYFEHPPLAQLSPDGKELYVAGKDGGWEARDAGVPAEVAARVPTPAGGLWLPPQPGHKYWVFCDGQTVTRVERATGAAAPVRLGDANQKGPRLLPVTVSPDDRTLVLMVGYDRTVLYDLHDGKVTAERKGVGEPTFSPDGKSLYWSSLPAVKSLFTVLDVATAKETPAVPGEIRAWLGRPAVSPDGKTVAVTDGYQVRLFDTAGGKERFPELGAGHVTAVKDVFAASGKVVSADMRTARVWEADTGKTVRALQPAGVLYNLHLSADGAWAGFIRAGGVELVDTATGKTRVTVPGPKGEGTGGQFLGFSDVGNLWFSSTTPGKPGVGSMTVHEVDPKTQAEVQSRVVLKAHPNFRPAVTADGRVVVTPGLRELSVWRLETGAVTRASPALIRGGTIRDFHHQALSPDGRVFAANRENFDSVEVWLTDPFLPAGRVSVADPPPEAAVVGAAAVGVEAVTRLRAAAEDPPLPEPGRPRPARVSALAVSADGRLVAVGRTDGTVCGLEAVSLGERFRARVSAGAVTAVAFTADGARLLVGGQDTVVSAWDLAALVPAGPDLGPGADAWAALGDRDPARAAAAVRKLAVDGAGAVALLREKGPAKPDRTLAQLVAGLSDADYRVREQAEDDLTKLGPAAIPALQAEALKTESAEVRARIESAVKRIRAFPFGPAGLTAEQVRAARAVEVLERVGSKEAAAVLAGWAKDHPGTLLGAEAKAAADRLTRRK